MNIWPKTITARAVFLQWVAELMKHNLLPHPDANTVNNKSMGENCKDAEIVNADVIKTVEAPMQADAGFLNLSGNLFDSAIIKTSGISPYFRKQFLSNPDDLNAFEGRVIVFDGPEGIPCQHRQPGP